MSLTVVRAVNLWPAADYWPIGKLCAALKAGGLVPALIRETVRRSDALATRGRAESTELSKTNDGAHCPTFIEYDKTLPRLRRGSIEKITDTDCSSRRRLQPIQGMGQEGLCPCSACRQPEASCDLGPIEGPP